MYKDHKSEGGWRQVVGGCSSNTLGLSNMISELLEAVTAAKENPYSVISSEDLLARISDTNELLADRMKANNKNPPKSVLDKVTIEGVDLPYQNLDGKVIIGEILSEILDELMDGIEHKSDPPTPQ